MDEVGVKAQEVATLAVGNALTGAGWGLFAFIGGASLGEKSALSEALSGMGWPQKLGTVQAL